MNDDNTTWLLLAGVIVIAGKWADGKGIDAPAVVALSLIAIMMAVVTQIDARVGKYLTILVLIVVTLRYGNDILLRLQGKPIQKLAAK